MTLALLYTGGTIGGRLDGSGPVSRAHSPAVFEGLLRDRLPAGTPPVTVHGVLGKLSENLEPADWARLARAVDRQIRGGADGIVIAHGTDTLLYSACALRWLLGGVPVPVVVTGSLLPLEQAGTDAVRNLAHALEVARQVRRPGVWISFAGRADASSLVLDPRNARKEADRTAVFQPAWGSPVGTVSARSGRVAWHIPPEPLRKPYEPRLTVPNRAVLFTVYPGFDPAWIRRAVRQGAAGMVLAGYGTGTACAAGSFDLRPAVREAVAKGVAVWLVSQHGGRVRTAYGSTAALERAGATVAPGLTPEAALTALMCLPRGELDVNREEGYRRLNSGGMDDERTGRGRKACVGF